MRMDDTGDNRICINDDNWSNLEAVEDIVFNIFLRLSIKSLALCEAVSKKWLRWILNPDFVSLHLSLSKENPIYIVFPYLTDDMVLVLMDEDGEPCDEDENAITFPGIKNVSYPNMICSYNGLICCTNDASPSSNIIELDVYICNPATLNVFLLPKCRPSEEEPSFGVAFGPRVNEYKVFRFFKAVCKSEEKSHECEIYSSSTGSWRSIGIVSHCLMGPMGSKHMFVNGKVYWFISSEGDPSIPASILSVDLEENFQTTALPNKATEYSFLVDLEGCLTMIISYPDKGHLMDIWVLMNCNECSTWVKKCSTHIPIPRHESVDSIAVRKSEMLFATIGHYLIFNLADRRWKVLVDDTFGRKPTVAFSYIKSLLPCNGVLES